MRFSEQVIAAVNEVRKFAPPVNLFDRDTMLSNLVFIYQVIKASERLLVEAEAEATGRLKTYYTTHLEEERDHAEWLADDLMDAGIDVNLIEPMKKAAEMAGAQYYLIKHFDPACLLGYMAVMEGQPYPVEMVDKLAEVHGEKLVRTLRFHAVHDQDHKIELFEVIDEIASPVIIRNAVQTALQINEISELLSRIGK